MPLALTGTEFQKAVWTALRQVPFGQTASYEDIAHMVGKPKAMRAVGTVIAQNKIALLIPCHRVIRKSGAIGEYRWGKDRKTKILEWERERG